MKVVILGGYGVFGARLATLLARDNHKLWIAGRSLAKAQALAETLNAQPLLVDIEGDLAPIFACAPDVVIDAAGPFQDYANMPSRVATTCLERGVDYLDLSDDARFTQAIAPLDEKAKAAGCRIISGASSVPGLSSSVVAELAKDMSSIDVIETAILPGNRAPRGVSVIASIAGRAGDIFPMWRGEKWQNHRVWTGRKRFRLTEDLHRDGFFIEVPDTQLFPDYFKARSVIFRAGMELWVLNAGLSALALLRRVWPVAITARRAAWIKRFADFLLPFGTDRGGMEVSVTGCLDGQMIRRKWRLIAEAGEGPFVPALVCRALLRHWDQVPIGARACLNEVSLARLEVAMQDLALTTSTEAKPCATLFQDVLKADWAQLPPVVQSLHEGHDVVRFTGQAEVSRGISLWARVIAAVFRFPRPAQQVAVTVTKYRKETHEIWVRDFDGRRFRSTLRAAKAPGNVIEAFGPFSFELDLEVRDGAIHLPVKRGWLGPLALPRWSLPVSESREFERDGAFHFDVSLRAPLTKGLIVRYQGRLSRGEGPSR